MISLYDILEAADGQLFGEPAAQIFTDFATDIDRVDAGCLYVALRTGHGDGHQYIQEAVDKGALGVVCTQPPGFDTDGVTVVIVRSVEQALMNWARIIMQKLGTTVIAVTGSAGKSTTVEAITAVLQTRYSVYRSAAGQEGRLSLPLALGRLSAQHQLAVLEMGPTQPGEMEELVEITQPLVAVVTNVSRSHIDQDGETAILAGEMELLIRSLPEGGLALLNYDDPRARAMAKVTAATVFSVGVDSFEADMLAFNIVVGRYKTGFDLRYGPERFAGRWIPLLGRHQVYAAMIALSIGLSYQISLEDGFRALTQLEPLPGRLRPLNGRNGCLVADDTFTVSPQSTQAALEWLGSVREPDSRLIFVMGDLGSLGNYAQRAHRYLGEQIAGVADTVITQGNLAAIAGRAAVDFGMSRSQVLTSYSYHDTAAMLQEMVGPHDVVLVKGSRACGMGEVVRMLLNDPGDENLLDRTEIAADLGWLGQRVQASWVEVDLGAVASNMRRLRQLIGPDVAVMAMVPADAYGHGAVAVGSTAVLNGAAYLGVGSLEEAIILRDAGLEAPILVTGYVPDWALRDAIHYDLSVSLADLDTARMANRIATDMSHTLKVHLHVDTGMGRLGLPPEQVMDFFRGLKSLPRLELEGVFTELVASDSDPIYTREQLAMFNAQINPLLATGITVRYLHMADTAALLSLPESRFSMVRAGLILQGLTPSPDIPLPPGFRPSLSWKTTIAQVRVLPRGSYVGEDRTYRTPGEERIAVIGVGYADGFRAAPQGWREVLVHGKRVPVVGRVGLHEAALSLNLVPAARAGDEVVLIGQQGESAIPVEEVADWLKCGVREVLASILPRRTHL